MASTPAPAIAFQQHDHAACKGDALTALRAVCARQGLRLTPVRARVLEILLERHQALGAYDILKRLHKEGFGAQPPVAYRALDFLISHGFAHKIERLNAFVACTLPGRSHDPAFMICRCCTKVAEAASPQDSGFGSTARAAGFDIERTVLEAEGLCPDCRNGAQNDAS